MESAELARRGWKAGQRANIDALTMQANYVLVRAWPTRARARPGDVDGGEACAVVVVVDDGNAAGIQRGDDDAEAALVCEVCCAHRPGHCAIVIQASTHSPRLVHSRGSPLN